MLQGNIYSTENYKQRSFFIAALILFLSIFLCFPSFSYAAEPVGDAVGLQPIQQSTLLGQTDIRVTFAKIVRAALGLMGLVALSLVLYAGFLWMTAGGNEEQITRAKSMLRNWVIGTAIILSSLAIVQFIISRLAGATGFEGGGGGGGGGPAQQGGLRTSAAGDIIQDHYPARNAKNIARNTKIMVTFSEAMSVATLVRDTNGENNTPNGTIGDCVQRGENFICDSLNTANVKISLRGQEDVGPFVEAADAVMTPDRRTLTIKPVQPLGSATEEVSYTVSLGSGIKRADNSSAFVGTETSYEWSFQTSRVLDTTPPFVVSFSPRGTNAVEKNKLVQITFSEAMDPSFLSGTTNLTPFAQIETVAADGTRARVNGKFEVSNGYQSVTFVPDDECGENTCGQTIYCLPGAKEIRPLFYTAQLRTPNLSQAVPGTGVVDAADNALDGGGLGAVKNSIANGPPPGSERKVDKTPNPKPEDYGADNFYFKFTTSNGMDLTPPRVVSFGPGVDAQDIVQATAPSAQFSEEMYYSSIATHARLESKDPAVSIGFFKRITDEEVPGRPGVFRTRLTLLPTEDLPTNGIFMSRLPSAIQDLAQNCFFPSVVEQVDSVQCLPKSENGQLESGRASCCNGQASGDVTCQL